MASSIEGKDRRARIGFGVGNIAVGAFTLFGVFRLLPTRWWVVDGGAVVFALLLGASGVLLLRRDRLAELVTRIASSVALVLGLLVFLALVVTATWIGGVYGQVGQTGAVLFALVSALVLPYAVVYPAVELAWIGSPLRKRK